MQTHLDTKEQDFVTAPVPLSERRGGVSLGLLWITMSVNYFGVLGGFFWFKDGYSLSQVIICSVVSSIILTAYAWASAYVGARSGQTWGFLNQRVFGFYGARANSTALVLVFLAFYALIAASLAIGLNGMFHTPIPTMWLAGILSIVMCANNVFGFTGVVNFARFIVAPALIIWVALTACKGIAVSPPTVWSHGGTVSIWTALTGVTSYILGLGIWGDEPDFWRFGKPTSTSKTIALPLFISFAIGFILFPITGWLLASLTGISGIDAGTNLVNTFAIGQFAVAAGVIMFLSYFAQNDSNLYGATTTLESMVAIDRKHAIACLTGVSILGAMYLSLHPDALETIFSINGFLLSVPSVILFTEFVVLEKLLGIKHDFSRVIRLEETKKVVWPATIALIAGDLVGLLTSGVIPGLQFLKVGICPVQAWVAAVTVFLIIRLSQTEKASLKAVAAEEVREVVKTY
jgi:purine-cytosine permease-like protein